MEFTFKGRVRGGIQGVVVNVGYPGRQPTPQLQQL
jgi:hypothetical protein